MEEAIQQNHITPDHKRNPAKIPSNKNVIDDQAYSLQNHGKKKEELESDMDEGED
ncbi:hypothetical protein CHS0354_034821 [Potamilus streckersoni]|uniref:Uncharacterized protein n=1 Tax=Potamilus streckersoni TaxID=2493646 RepID=A0AAE0RSV5_9BIVA|nr:hypothetical protein CHS0354_034821 [Potamilus streckersoni]